MRTHGIFMPNAAYSDDNIISLGIHSDDCFGNVTLCPDGIAFSLWFKLEALFKSPSHLYDSTYLHAFLKKLANGNLILSVNFKNGTHRLRYESFPDVTLNAWHHLGLTYSPKYGMGVYYDGSVQTGSFEITSKSLSAKDFQLGCTGGKFCIRVTYDDLRFWKVWKRQEFMLYLWSM